MSIFRISCRAFKTILHIFILTLIIPLSNISLAANSSNTLGSTPESTKKTISKIPAILNKMVASKKTPSIVVAVIDNQKIKFYSAGDAAPGIKAGPDVIYSIGSVTKTFTAQAFLKIAIENNIDIHLPVCDLMSSVCTLPISVAQKNKCRDITFFTLLTHTSGLPRLPDNFAPKDPLQPYQDYSMFNFFSFLKNYRPGAVGTYLYSNLGSGLLGWITTRLEYTKGIYSEIQSYEDVLKNHIFTPLKMNNTFINHCPDSNDQDGSSLLSAAGTYKGEDVPYWKFTQITAGCGSIKSTARDMIKYISYQMARPDYKNAALYLATQKSHSCTQITVATHVYMGLGWHILKIKNKKIKNKQEKQIFNRPAKTKDLVWHNGQTYGFRSFIGFDKEEKKGVVIMCSSGSADIDSLGFSILAGKIR